MTRGRSIPWQDGFEEGEEAYQFEFIRPEELKRICCPITALPVRDPVLAADGHAYERCVHLYIANALIQGLEYNQPPTTPLKLNRSAIQRWLENHDTSPMTGAPLRTLELYECRAMRETVEEFRQRNEALRRKAAAVVSKGVFSRPGKHALCLSPFAFCLVRAQVVSHSVVLTSSINPPPLHTQGAAPATPAPPRGAPRPPPPPRPPPTQPPRRASPSGSRPPPPCRRPPRPRPSSRAWP